MRCSNCGHLGSLDDNFCRKCGASLRNVRVPAARNSSQLPVAWRGAMPVLARGAAVFALGAVIQMLLRMVGRRAVSLPASLAKRRPAKNKASRLPATKDGEEQPEASYAVQETLFLRRIILRR
ncbi:MAG: zinc ribbon domain-containing protein [Dehalococcoidia bacterium]|nr:MAG: zinc ribbon domain-containing protein [Dehalococcoidia bacterium]